ncbi:MAG: 3'(2'),5'-bisphosphate nucleotidase CysQ [Candidatus Nanoarchaeia archaeon]
MTLLTQQQIHQLHIKLQHIGEEILKIYNSEFSHKLKADKSPLTQADTLSHNQLIEFLKYNYSKYNIISEEDKNTTHINLNQPTWLIDPLDGTKDFVQKTDEFSIMLALLNTNNQPIAGFVYQPPTHTFFYAQKGEGAYKIHNDSTTQLHVSTISQINESKLVHSRNHFSKKDEAVSEQLNITQFIKAGSVGIKFCKIAQGQAELCYYTTDKMGIWDDASAHIILKEAGGDVFDINGDEPTYNYTHKTMKNGFIGTNGNISKEKILNTIKNL